MVNRCDLGDYDRDGRLDLFVPGYVHFDPDNPPIAGHRPIPEALAIFEARTCFAALSG